MYALRTSETAGLGGGAVAVGIAVGRAVGVAAGAGVLVGPGVTEAVAVTEGETLGDRGVGDAVEDVVAGDADRTIEALGIASGPVLAGGELQAAMRSTSPATVRTIAGYLAPSAQPGCLSAIGR